MENQQPYQPKYVMLNGSNSTNLRPPPQRRNIPRYHANESNGKECCRCICCCLCIWLSIIIFMAAGLFYLYSTLQPEMPRYNVDRFDVRDFNVHSDFSLNTEFVVVVKSENPNKHIGFDYGEDSSVVVSYKDSPLCSGEIPSFEQPSDNTSMITIVLKGKSEFGSGLQEALMQNRNTGKIPLLVEVKAPVSIVLKDFPLRQVTVLVNCSMVVDNLSPNKKAKILSTEYQYGLAI